MWHSKKTKPCLGLIEGCPGQRFFVKELWAQSIKEVLRRPSEPAGQIRHYFRVASHPASILSATLPFAVLCAWLDADMIIFRRVVLNALMADDIELFIL